MGPVVSDSRRARQIRRRNFWRQRVQFQRQQSKPSYIGCPPPQVAGQVFLQFVTRDFFPEVGKRSGGFPDTSPSSIIRRRNVWPVVVEEGTHMEKIVDVQ